jgi:hypothetical protein
MIQIPITAGCSEALQDKKLAQGFTHDQMGNRLSDLRAALPIAPRAPTQIISAKKPMKGHLKLMFE